MINEKKLYKRKYHFTDLQKIANEFKIPNYEVNGSPGRKLIDYYRILNEMNLECLLVLGWYYIIPTSIRNISKYEAWGIHTSLLPKYVGGAPLAWAMINGEKETGVTLFRLNDGIDNGDIIAQKSFKIDCSNTIREVYEKATIASKEILKEIFYKLYDGIKFIPQNKAEIKIYPRRFLQYGEINWYDKAENIYNFIRAQTLPYPCAFSYLNDYKIFMITSQKIFLKIKTYLPGTIVFNSKIGTIVATKDYFIKIGDIKYEGKKIRFEDFARAKKIWGGYSRAEVYRNVA